MVDDLKAIGGVDGLCERVTELVALPPKVFAKNVPTVEVKSIPKNKSHGDVEKRPIVVPPVLRRALSNHISEILQVTADHLLPKEAIAYRPNKKRVVEMAILDVQRAVRGGGEYWAKLDIRNFFPSVPWEGIRNALRAYKYPEEFIEYVMALVQGRLMKAEGRSWVPVKTISGTQAGLRESSILANLYLSDLDRILVTTFGGDVFYRRYCDDMILLGKTKKAVRQAVVEVRNWLESRGLALKVAPDVDRPDARSLVHGVAKKRILFLGAEIDSRANVFIPKEKVQKFWDNLKHMNEYVPFMVDDVYYGTSKFAKLLPKDVPRGIDRFDEEDLAQVMGEFIRWWKFLGAVNLVTIFEETPCQTLNPELLYGSKPNTWVGYLGGHLVLEGILPGGLPVSV
jgi:hypothetical protein